MASSVQETEWPAPLTTKTKEMGSLVTSQRGVTCLGPDLDWEREHTEKMMWSKGHWVRWQSGVTTLPHDHLSTKNSWYLYSAHLRGQGTHHLNIWFFPFYRPLRITWLWIRGLICEFQDILCFGVNKVYCHFWHWLQQCFLLSLDLQMLSGLFNDPRWIRCRVLCVMGEPPMGERG
jgi:hypothetical protein